ncbi:MAG: hypothetical protein ACPHXW_00200 [Marinobacterium sp.]
MPLQSNRRNPAVRFPPAQGIDQCSYRTALKLFTLQWQSDSHTTDDLIALQLKMEPAPAGTEQQHLLDILLYIAAGRPYPNRTG